MFGWLSGEYDSERLARIEAKLDLILHEMGIAFHDPSDPKNLPGDAKLAADAGRKIEAIRLYRVHSDVSLREAKLAVDKYMAQKRA